MCAADWLANNASPVCVACAAAAAAAGRNCTEGAVCSRQVAAAFLQAHRFLSEQVAAAQQLKMNQVGWFRPDGAPSGARLQPGCVCTYNVRACACLVCARVCVCVEDACGMRPACAGLITTLARCSVQQRAAACEHQAVTPGSPCGCSLPSRLQGADILGPLLQPADDMQAY